MESWLQILVTVLGTLGGFESVKWLANLKNNARIADSEADASEFHVLQETVEFLQTQLKEKEVRFAEQTELLRKVQKERFDESMSLMQQVADLRVELTEKKCEDMECPFRQPPNAYTKPSDGKSKEAYHKCKNQNKQ